MLANFMNWKEINTQSRLLLHIFALGIFTETKYASLALFLHVIPYQLLTD